MWHPTEKILLIQHDINKLTRPEPLFLWSSVGPCKQTGNCQSSCWCMFWTWFTTDTHLATVSSPVMDEAAAQYMWFTMLWIHSPTTWQPFWCARLSSFLLTPTYITVEVATNYMYISTCTNTLCQQSQYIYWHSFANSKPISKIYIN